MVRRKGIRTRSGGGGSTVSPRNANLRDLSIQRPDKSRAEAVKRDLIEMMPKINSLKECVRTHEVWSWANNDGTMRGLISAEEKVVNVQKGAFFQAFMMYNSNEMKKDYTAEEIDAGMKEVARVAPMVKDLKFEAQALLKMHQARPKKTSRP